MALRSVAIGYCWPSELDLMAAQAGFRLAERYSDWTSLPYDGAGSGHVSVYRPG
jgi:hypothetical protein